MRGFEQRKRGGMDPVRLLGRRLILIGLFALLFVSGRAVWVMYEKSRDASQKEARAESRVGSLEVRESQLRANIAYLHTERGQEEKLRQEYELAKEGEGLIVIVEERPEPPPPPPTFPSIEWFKGRFFTW